MHLSRGVFREGAEVILKMENDLGRDDIGRLVWRIAIPSMLAPVSYTHLLGNNVVQSAMASGGTIPPAITAAII